jgi:hypothetical protein
MRRQYHFWPGRHGVDAWDVDRLIELARDLPVDSVPVGDIREVDSVYWFDNWHRPTVRSVVEHWQLMQATDLAYPVILGPDGRVMDGMHRIARALVEQRSTIDAVRFLVLPPADHLDCRPQDLPYDRSSDNVDGGSGSGG